MGWPRVGWLSPAKALGKGPVRCMDLPQVAEEAPRFVHDALQLGSAGEPWAG